MKKFYLLPGIVLSGHAMAQGAPASDALPEGGHVIAGEAVIGQRNNTLSIQQSSDRAAIDWEGFDVGSRATVEFLQPSSSSVTLNRVSGANASQIFGRITANGQVFLSNPNGVYFAPGASVNVGGLVATTHSISLEDFMAGRVKFERSGATGSVVNEGEMTAALGGYIALLAPEVRNQGLILANLGTVALAAGETFELQFGSNNTLANLRVTPSAIKALVDNRSAVLAPGGLIILSAQAVDRIQGGVIRHSGVLEATGVAQRGGRIVLEGNDISLAADSRIDASGETGGGEVLVGGDWQGSGDILQARRVTMESGARIDVSATGAGDGGTAVLWSDVHAVDGGTTVRGEITARGGVAGGEGGRVETSGHVIGIDGISVDASAPQGRGGTWLIDPYSYSIGAPAAATISNALSNGTSVMVTTTANNADFGSSGNVNDTGGIAVTSAITKSGGSDATLTLQAHRNISINAPISSSVGRLNTVLWSDYGNNNLAGVVVSSAINTNGGHLWIGGSASSAGNSTWNGLTVGNGPSVGSLSGNYNSMDLSANITTGGGDVLIWTGQGVTDGSSQPGIGLNGARSIDAGSGDVTLLTNKVFNWQNGGALSINSTGHLTLAPSLGNAYDAAFSWSGTDTGGNFRLNNTLSANTLTINNVAALGGITIGQFSGMDGVSLTNTSNVTISNTLGVAGPISLLGGQLAINANLTSSASGDIFLKSLSSANPSIFVNADILKTGGARSTLTLQGQGRVQLNSGRKIEATGTALDVVFWSDFDNSNSDGGVTIQGNISTNGGHLWAGGSNSAGGSYTWNGLAVGDGASIGTINSNYNAMDVYGTVSTSGGDILLWAGGGYSGGLSGIGGNSTGSLDAGSGDITLIADETAGTFPLSTTGMLSIVPDGGSFPGAFTWNGSGTPNVTLSGSFAGLRVNNFANLGGLTIGHYTGMRSGSTPVVLGNTSTVDVNSAISVAGPLGLYGGAVNALQNLAAAGDITLKANVSDVVLEGTLSGTSASASALTIEAARHIRVGSNASIASSTAAMTTGLWADSNADGDGIVYLTSSGIDTRGGSLTFGRDGQSANIGGTSVRVGGDVFFQRGSAQTLSTGGGALNIYGETIVANTSGLTINTSNGAAHFHGLLNSGNGYSFVDKTGSGGSGTWDAARTEARNGTAGGSALGDSYLVTVTSRLENAIAGLTANYRGSWIGAHRPNTSTYNWTWADGPEGGQTFFTQDADGGGTPAAGFYANFGAAEPNGDLNANRASTESSGQFFGSAGLWNDLTYTTNYSATQANQYAVLGFVRETNLAASAVTINAGTGAVTVQGGVGVSKALASLNVTSSATTVNGSGLVTTGAQSYSSGLTANAGSSNLLLQGSGITAGGAVLASGAHITLNADITGTATGAAIEARASGNITSAAGLTLQTNDGNLTLWSDSDGNGAGHIALGNGNTLNSANGATAQSSGGGRITLAGGSAVDVAGLPVGFAASTTVHGVALGSNNANTTTIQSGGGDVLVKGSTTTTSSTGDGTFHGVTGWGALHIDAGQGAISMAGASTDSYGLILSRGGSGASTLSSGKSTGTAISLAGVSTAAEAHGLVLDNAATEDILATGGGNIALTGTGTGTHYGVWLQGSRVLASGGVIAVNGGTGGINAVGSYNILGKSISGVTASSSDITLTADRINLAGNTVIDTSGRLTLQPFGTSFSGALNWPLTNLTLAPGLTGLTLGKMGNTADITVGSTQSIAGPVNIHGGNIAINAGLAAVGDTMTLRASGNITDGASGHVSALNLLLLGGDVTLDSPNNSVGQLAASGVGNVTFIDSDALALGTVGGTSGISATGAVNIATRVGDLTLLDDVITTSTGTTALTLNAGMNAAAGTVDGGGIIVPDDAIVSVGAGGRGQLLTGGVADSGVRQLLGSGSNRFRYNSDELATNYTLALGSGLYGIYREQPTVGLRIDDKSMVYGAMLPSWSFSLEDASNGDTFSQSFSGAPVVSVGGGTSTSGSYTVGGHALTGTIGSAVSQLGYAVSPTIAGGALTVTPRALTVSYTADGKIYDGNAMATVNASDDRVASDVLAIEETARFDDINAGTGKTVSITGIGLSGADADNYTVANSGSTTADITPRTLTLAANRVYDGTTVLDASAVTLGNLVGSEQLGFSGASASDAHVATGGKFISSIALLDGGNGGLAGNYQLPTLNAANAPVTITARTLGGSAAIGGALSRIYDGTTNATGANVSGSITGAVSGDVIALDARGLVLAYNSSHVANATSIGATGSSGFSISSSTNGSLASDYAFTAPTIAPVSASITPATLTPTLINSGISKAYDGTTDAPAGFVPAWSYSGLVAGDSAASLSASGMRYDSKDVATAGRLTVSGLGIDHITGSNGSAASDYALDALSKDVAASITAQALTVTGLVAADKTYDGSNAVTLVSAGSVLTGVGAESLNLSHAGASFSDANAGVGKSVTASGYALSDGGNGGLASNYSLTSTSASTTASISKAVLTVIANDDAKFVTLPDAPGYNGISFNGFVAGETAGVLGGAATVSRNNPGANSAGLYADVLAPNVSGLTSLNYSFAPQNGNYTIVPANQLLVRVANGIAAYGTQAGYTLDSAQYVDGNSGNVITLNDITDEGNGRFTVRDGVGGAASFTVAPEDASRSGAGFVSAGAHQLDATNVSTQNAQNFGNQLTLTGSREVTRRGISASATGGVSKVYDGSTAMTGVLLGLTGAESADALRVSGAGEFSSRNVGANLGYSVSGLALDGEDAGNYFLTGGTEFSGNNGAITPRTLLVRYGGQDKVYDGSTQATVSMADDRITGDQLMLDAAAAFTDKNVGSAKTVTITGVTLSGADAGNYVVSASDSTVASITRLDAVRWIGGNSGNWFDPANWAGGAVPDLANVANVILPDGVNVSFDITGARPPAESGPVLLDSLGSAGSVSQNNGTLQIGAGGMQLEGYTQNGGVLDTAGGVVLTTFSQSGGNTTTAGHFTVVGDFSQGAGGSLQIGGDARITDLSGGTTLGNLGTGGDLIVSSLDGDITQAGGTTISVEGDADLRAPGNIVTLSPLGNSFGGAVMVVDASPARTPPVPPPAPPRLSLPTPQMVPALSGIGLMDVSVVLVTAPSDQAMGLVTVAVPRSLTSTGFAFTLPGEIVRDLPATGAVTVSREDGGRLPPWLSHALDGQRFEARPIPAEVLPLRLLLKIGAHQITVVIALAEDIT